LQAVDLTVLLFVLKPGKGLQIAAALVRPTKLADVDA
jgi:hypothetical protein